MSIRNATVAFALSLLTAGNASADSYTIDPRHTFPSFEVSHIGFSTQRGRFDRTSGKIQLDSATKSGKIEVAMEADSIDTGLAELENRLKEADFFNVKEHPRITFESNAMEFAGETPVAATGTLTLLGTSKPVRLSIDHFHCGVHPISKRYVCGANASGLIKRSDFGMKAFLPAVGDEVVIKIQVEAFKD